MLRILKSTLVVAAIIVLVGCELHPSPRASLESYIDPSYSSKEVKFVVVFPMTNAAVTAGQAQEMSRAFAQGMLRNNPQVVIMGAGEAIDKINAANLSDEWATFLRNYNTSGIPNTQTVKRLGQVLGVDAIVQGTILNVTQKDSSGLDYPCTRVNVRYGAISTKSGAMLWEISSEGTIQPYSYTAAPVIEALKIAHEKILSSIPK